MLLILKHLNWRQIFFLGILKAAYVQGRWNGFQSAKGPWNTKKYWRSRMPKTVTFSAWWQPFNSFCFQILSFFHLFPFFLFATQKSQGGGDTCPPAPHPPSVAGTDVDNFVSTFNNFHEMFALTIDRVMKLDKGYVRDMLCKGYVGI